MSAHRQNPLCNLNAAGQSVWCDHIHRGMLTSGGLATMIQDDDLRGITSNPSIFDKAISSTHEYDPILQRELRQNPNASSRELFFALAIEDIREACDIIRPVYEATEGMDGMVSLEVSPDLTHDTTATISNTSRPRWRPWPPEQMSPLEASALFLAIAE